MSEYRKSLGQQIQCNGKRYVYISNSGAIFQLDDESYQSWDAVENGGPRSLTSEDPALRDMIDLGLVRRRKCSQVFERKPLFLDTLLKRGIGSLALLISEGCNLSCSYCFADGGRYGRSIRSRMSPAIANRWLQFLMRNSDVFDTVDVTFMGGEPLLDVSLIRDIVEAAKNTEARYRKRIQFAVTTNATRITPEVAEFLDTSQISVLVSIDGPPDVQDRNRPNPEGKGSYDDVARGISILKKHYRFRPLPARVTVTRQCLDLGRIYRHLRNMGFNEVGFSPVSTDDESLRLNEQEYGIFIDRLIMLSEECLREESGNGMMSHLSNLNVSFSVFHEGIAKPFPCGAGIGLFAGDADGDLYFCHRLVGSKQWKVGTLDKGIDNGRREKLLDILCVDGRDDCKDCWLKFVCSGGCYHEMSLLPGECHRQDFCPSMRKWMRYVLESYIRRWDAIARKEAQ